jgi:hypothetical protein
MQNLTPDDVIRNQTLLDTPRKLSREPELYVLSDGKIARKFRNGHPATCIVRAGAPYAEAIRA